MSDPTTDPSISSFVDVDATSDFPIQNLPYGIFRLDKADRPRVGVAIGDRVLDLAACFDAGLFDHPALEASMPFHQSTLNPLMSLGKEAWSAVRTRVHDLLRDDTPDLRDDADLQKEVMVDRDRVEMLMPVDIGDYTDFYSSREHATNIGTMFRGPENALKPNWLHLPVGYHGRASSIIPSGQDVRRPSGQLKPDEDKPPIYGPSNLLDFELEVGALVGPGNELGSPIDIDDAGDHVFGLVLVNDWSARDIQKWEYVPLGPFLGKSFATTISPWVVPMAALDPFRVDGPEQDPEPLEYLKQSGAQNFDIELKVGLQTESMDAPHTICETNFSYMYWSVAQQVAHHTVNGCNLRPGDMLASGTISGPTEDSYGSMLELSWRGERPLEMPSGETRSFLQDGDRVVMSGHAQGDDYRVGFGTAEGTILPAK
ncbi:fumarylacetoacetase [Longibacter salinarum]|uniref:fumarylacetoacetase n=1 Tax=Longibacter salinarum TaxID=1850348 RepID=A0A2A8D0X5_9BACT|nr:fumarylacetoacetase [Longibacter salinarum]PEN14576.1 fumarylacetoacetase [Longibacter salinarum]